MVSDKHRVLIVGLGVTGMSCARYLASQGIEVAVTDSREKPPALAELRKELPNIAVFTGGFDERVFSRADELIVSPGVSLKHPLIVDASQQGKKILGDIELFAQQAQAPVVVITGSNGKSTVTSLVGMMAREAGLDVRVGGNIGKPALDLLAESEPDMYVLELSSFQLEYTDSLNASVATVLNITEDHMDRYEHMSEYIDAKKRAYRGSGVMILNRDDPRVMDMAMPLRRILTFGLQPANDNDYGTLNHEDETWLARGNTALIRASELKITGLHNIANALAALAIGEAAGFSQSAMLSALKSYPGLPHRCQFVRELDEVRWYNDSKGTNVGATVAAIQGIQQPVVLIAGGDAKGADFSSMKSVVEQKVHTLVLLGKDAQRIAETMDGLTSIVQAKNMQQAVELAQKHAHEGDAVLLSPACASFDMFSGYEQRGEVFMQSVRKLK
jgi:UDP-N-acetylmuramoylalanine--D-glutamate ligase